MPHRTLVIVECPACHTRYRISDTATLNENTLFECSQDRCQQRFPCPPELLKSEQTNNRQEQEAFSEQTPEDDTAAEPLKEVEPARRTQALTPPPIPPKAKAPSTPPPPPPSTSPAPFHGFEDEDFSLDEEEELQYPLDSLRNQGESEIFEEELVPDRKRASSSAVSTLSPRLPFIFLGILVLGYAGLGLYSRTHLDTIEAILARLPFIGPRFIASQFSVHYITLSEIKSTLALTKDSKQILIISGKATNTAPVPAATIQIEGTLYDDTGKVLSQRRTFCGTETAVETLTNLTTREIAILQNVAPPKQFSVASGKSINFLIVFVNPPSTVSRVESRVFAVQFRTPD